MATARVVHPFGTMFSHSIFVQMLPFNSIYEPIRNELVCSVENNLKPSV